MTDYRLKDLVAATGFTLRQIRYYIGERLIPGAGDDRGPNTMYGQETLDRLKLIARFKATPFPPAGRTMTLEEIRRTLDGLQPDELHRMAREAPLMAREAPSMSLPQSDCLVSYRLAPRDDDPRTLLRQVREVLEELARPRSRGQAVPGDGWRRISTPDLEINVKEPTDAAGRHRLHALAEDLAQLLAEER